MDPSSAPPTFDDVLQEIGGTGPFQIILFIILFALGMFSVETIYINFIAVKLPHWCKVRELQHLPFNVQKQVAIPSTDINNWASTTDYSKCQMFSFNYSGYTTRDFLSWNRTAMAAVSGEPIKCTDGWVYDKSQFASSAAAEFDLVCDKEWLISLLSTAYTAGMFLGAVSAGFFSDKYGRRPVLVIWCMVKLVGGVFSVYAPNYAALIIARMIIGFGSTGVYLITFVLIVEVSVGVARTAFGVGLMIAFAVGYMLIPVVALAVRDFRMISWVSTGPAFIGFFLWWIIPESPRWLLVNKKFERAEKAIRVIASVNNKPLPDDFDVSKITVEDPRKAELPKRNILDLFKRTTIRKWTLIVYLHWFTDSLVYYAMSLNSGNLAGDIFLNTFLLGFVEVPANVILTFILQWKRLGRRLSSSFSLLLAGGTSIISIPLVVTGASPIAVTVLSLLGKAGSTMGFSAAYVYTGEIFPTEVRNVAMGSASTVARISGMAAPFVGGVLGKAWKGLPFLVYGAFGIAAGLLTLMLPETLGRPLCETLEEAEDMAMSKGAVAPEPTETKMHERKYSNIELSSSITHRKPSTFAAHINPVYDENE